MVKCKYYNEEHCSKDCNDEWHKCDICDETLKPSPEGTDDINAYTIYSANFICDDFENLDLVKVICLNCYKGLEKLKEIKSELWYLVQNHELLSESSFQEFMKGILKKIGVNDV